MISIIMPFKNESLHIIECLESITKQTHQKFELIAIDDSSEDDSFDLISKYCEQDKRIRVYSNPGSGIIDALQFASIKAQGEFITRQDADDIMPENKLTLLLELLQKNGTGHVSTGLVKYFSTCELKDGFKKYESWINSLCLTSSHYDHIFKECILVSSNWLMYKSDFDNVNGFNDSVYPEDYHFAFKLFHKKLKIVSVYEITHLWRDHPQRASRNLEQYKDQKFFPLKVGELCKTFDNKSFALWGAGPTGKKLAKELIKQNIHFHWVTNNENKIGKKIYDVSIHHFDTLKENSEKLLIISVTQRDALKSIISFLDEIAHKSYREF
jgi:glycosyltransferase involved in cell wall biosynthesis